jgi:hypothetical protein
VKKVIELLEEAKITLGWGMTGDLAAVNSAYDRVKSVLEELRSRPRWETPEQFEKLTGKPWPDNVPVWTRHQSPITGVWYPWNLNALKNIQDYYRSTNCESFQIVTCNGPYPPPDDWKPEEMDIPEKEAQTVDYETVEQWEKRTGRKYPEKALVYVRFVNKFTDPKSVSERKAKGKSYYWSLYEYERTRPFRTANLIILANELGPPPDDWRPELKS